MKRLIWLLLISSCFAQTWATWNGITVGSSSTNISGWNGTTIGTSSTNIGAWNGLTSPGGAAASFGTIVQEQNIVYATDCNFASPTDCTKTITSTGSGHLLIVASTRQNNAAEYIASITSGLCSGSWQYPAGSQATGGAGSVAYAYCLSSVSGQTSITVTYTNWQGRPVIKFYEISYTGTASFVTSGANFNASSNTSQTGIALTLTGATAYATCQLDTNGVAIPSAVTSPYNTDYSGIDSNDHAAFAAFSCALNNSSGTAPTWTQANASASLSGIAFGVN